MDKPVALSALSGAETLNVFSKPFARINNMDAWATKFEEHPLWERNPNSDKLVVGIAGKLQFTILRPEGEQTVVVGPGEVFRIPGNTWHSPKALGVVEVLTVCDYTGTELQETHPRG